MNNNVGIITFHRSYNYGSALQAYALQKQVENLGYHVQVIDFTMKSDFEQYKLLRTHLYKKQPKSLAADIVFFFPHLRRKQSFNRFVQNHLHLTEHQYTDAEQMGELNKSMGIFICGSDQIWNVDCTGGVEPAFFLSFAGDDKQKIAYAPSMAHAFFRVEDETEQKLAAMLRRLDAVSIREETNLPYLQKILAPRNVVSVLDPTLLLDRSDYEDLIQRSQTGEASIFVYMLEENAELIRYAQRLQKETGYKLYYVSQKMNCGFKTGENCFGVTPEEFLGYIDSSGYVITNSFHATVFSILFHKKFCVFPTAKSGARMVDLIKKLHIQSRIFSEEMDISAEIDYASVDRHLAILRAESREYLTNALKGAQNHE